MVLFSTSGAATNLVLTHKGVSVTIYIDDETENLTKNLIAINPPQTTGNQPTTASSASYTMKIIDILNKVEQRITVSGWIDSTDGGDTSDTKRTYLRNMFLAGGLITITTLGGHFDGLSCAIDKLEIKRIKTDNTRGDGIAEYQVTISMLIGTAFG